jgi:hypothetical protein
MAIEIYVTDSDPENIRSLNEEGEQILKTFGDQSDSIAVQLKELFSSVTESVSASIEIESQLQIEVTGSITLKASAEGKYLFFNIGGEASTTGTMKVSLSTKLKPSLTIKSE